VVSAARACGFTDEYALVLHAWRKINIVMRQSIDEPPEGTTLERFMQTVRRKQTNWTEQAQRMKGQSYQSTQRNSSGNNLYGSNQSWNQRGNSSFRGTRANSYQNQGNYRNQENRKLLVTTTTLVKSSQLQ
jgi:hypothetical protein